MKIRHIVEADVTLPELVSHLLHGGPSRLSEVVMPKYGIGDAVQLRYPDPGLGAQDDIAVVTEILPYNSDEHGDHRCYSVRYADRHGNVQSIDVTEGKIAGVVLASRSGYLASRLLDDEDVPERLRPISHLRDLCADIRRTGALDVLVRGDDPGAALEAFEDAESVVDDLCRNLGQRVR